MKEQLDSLYEYGEWATQRLLVSAAACTEAQFKQKVLPSFGSVHLTLAHVLGAEFLWLARLQGNSPKTMLSPNQLSTLFTMHGHWAELIDQRHAYFATLGEADLETKVIFWHDDVAGSIRQ